MPYFDHKLFSSGTESLPPLFPSQCTDVSCNSLFLTFPFTSSRKRELSPSICLKRVRKSLAQKPSRKYYLVSDWCIYFIPHYPVHEPITVAGYVGSAEQLKTEGTLTWS